MRIAECRCGSLTLSDSDVRKVARRFGEVRRGSPNFTEFLQGSPSLAVVRKGSLMFVILRCWSLWFSKRRIYSRFNKVSMRFDPIRLRSSKFDRVLPDYITGSAWVPKGVPSRFPQGSEMFVKALIGYSSFLKYLPCS